MGDACRPVLKLTFLVVWFIYTIVCLNPARADNYASFMLGVFSSARDAYTETKFLCVGHREPLIFGFTHQYEAGGWTDIAGGGRSGSLYAAYQVGVEAGEGAIGRIMLGPAIITRPDAYLGGPFEFTEDLFLGIKGGNGNIIGVKYKHLSSAGIYQPNEGRDLLGIEASIKF